MNFGCIASPVDLRDYKLKTKVVKAINTPEEFKITMQHKVKNQGNVSSCVAHAVASILEYYNNIRLSTNFIYGIRKKLYNSTGLGMSIREACKIVTKYGDMSYNDCNGNTEIDKVYEIAEKSFNDKEKLTNAYKHKCRYYVSLNSIDDIKYFLMTHGPVIASINWFKDFKYNKETKILERTTNGLAGTFHAIMIYGWCKDGWLCQNSWGSNWGNNGLFILEFKNRLYECYGLVDDKSLSDETDIVKPTYEKDFIDRILRVLNYFIAKLFTRNK